MTNHDISVILIYSIKERRVFMKPILPLGVKLITERLEKHGKSAHIVGGCVRDFLLSKTPYDYDITTNALPEEMKEIFSDFKTVETGIKHGTLTVLCDGNPYEVTTYRIDGEYEDHRHPTSVLFTDKLASDLSRRDFTMNAICYSERDGFVDMFSGIEDIKNRIIRAVGEPSKRFDEDALRILRAIRFASVLGFEIEENTAESAKEKAVLLASVSAERIYTEWKKLLSGVAAHSVISEYGDIVSVFLFAEPIVLPPERLFASASFEARQLSLFELSLENPRESFESFCDRMKTDAKTKKIGALALGNLGFALSDAVSARLMLIRIGEEATRLVAELKRLKGEKTLTQAELDLVVNGDAPLSLSALKAGGEDMKEIGFVGKEIGEALERLLIMTAKGELKNEREALLSAAGKLKNGI